MGAKKLPCGLRRSSAGKKVLGRRGLCQHSTANSTDVIDFPLPHSYT